MENGKADIELNLERLIQRPMIKVEDHSGLGDVCFEVAGRGEENRSTQETQSRQGQQRGR